MKYIKTELGQRAFKERSTALSAKQRAAFIMMDGKRTVPDVLQATAGLGLTGADIAQMLAQGLISEETSAAVELPAVPAAEATPQAVAQTSLEVAPMPPAGLPSPKELYLRAYPIATQLTANMGLRGLRLNLAVENAAGFQQLVELVPRIREAVGPIKSRPLEEALGL